MTARQLEVSPAQHKDGVKATVVKKLVEKTTNIENNARTDMSTSVTLKNSQMSF